MRRVRARSRAITPPPSGVFARGCFAPNRLKPFLPEQPSPNEKPHDAAKLIGILAGLAMRGGNDEAVLIVGDRHQAVHLLDVVARQTDVFGDAVDDDAINCLGAHIRTHGQHTPQCALDRLGASGGQQVGEILHRDAQ